MLRGGISLSPDQTRVEMAREQAILKAGKKFISLRLIDQSKNRIQGAMCLHATPYLDSQTNMTKFHFEERGGPLNFEIDDYKGGMYCKIMDCEHNRKFLASMYSSSFWEIEDKEAEADIKKCALEIKNTAVLINQSDTPKEKMLSDDEIEAEMARLQGEAARRKIAKSELLGKKNWFSKPKDDAETVGKQDNKDRKGSMVSID